MSEIEKKEEWYLNIDYQEAKEIIRILSGDAYD